MNSVVTMYADGASRGNPGPASLGVVLLDAQQNVLAEIAECIGEATNNVAEYAALLTGLQKARELRVGNIQVFMDSELVVKQVQGQYRVKNEGLKPYYLQVVQLIKEFRLFQIAHVKRADNHRADALANQALDQQQSKQGI